jgi:C-terminal processing protease CtpA/Prc
LGNTLFRNFVVYCDYLNERVILEKGVNFNREFPADHSGLQIIRGEKEGYEIMYVSEDTPADKAGFQEGDILRSINGVDVEYFGGLTAVRKILREDPGTKYSVVIDREGKEKKINIKLANLF